MHKKIKHFLGAALLLPALLAGAAAPVLGPCTVLAADAPSLRVALVLEQNDAQTSLGAALRQGLERARQEGGVELSLISVPDAAQSEEAEEQQLAAFQKAASGHDVVVLATPGLHEVLMNQAGNFRKTRFVCLGAEVKAPNIASVTFADTEVAFLSGAAAATLTVATQIPGINEQRVLGWIGAFDTPTQRAELEAFLQGARLINGETRVLSTFINSQDDSEAARKAALELYAQGADVVAHNLGSADAGVMQAAETQGRYAIGRDAGSAPPAEAVRLFSQQRRTDDAVFDLIKSAKGGTFPGNTVTEKNLANQGVGLHGLEATQQRLGKAFPAELPQRLRELSYEIARGGITVPKVRKKTLCDCL